MDVNKFAGFTFPKPLWTMPRPTKVLKTVRSKTPSRIFRSHIRAEDKENVSHYFGGDGSIQLRQDWVDDIKIPGRGGIDHYGWYSDIFQEETYRGIVFYLPHGRLLIGYGVEDLWYVISRKVFTDLYEARTAADELARVKAEESWEYSEKQKRLIDLKDELGEIEDTLGEALKEVEEFLQAGITEEFPPFQRAKSKLERAKAALEEWKEENMDEMLGLMKELDDE